MELQLTAQEVGELMQRVFGMTQPLIEIEEVRQGYARTRLRYHSLMLRPGGTLSGPAMFTASDLAMYALVLSHLGPQVMAVTANMNMNFLNKPEPGDILAECRLLKRGRRLMVMEASLYSSAAPGVCVAHVTGSYALPGTPAPA